MPAVFEYGYQVADIDIDGVGHVNNLSYLRWLQDAAVAHSAAQGWPAKAYHERGHGWVVRTHFIEYLNPAWLDDQIVVRTWVADMKRVTSRRRYVIMRSGDSAVLCKAETNWAFVRFADHQICRIPAEIAAAFEVVDDANAPVTDIGAR